MSHRVAIWSMKHFLHLFHKLLHAVGAEEVSSRAGSQPRCQRRKLRLGGEWHPAQGLAAWPQGLTVLTPVGPLGA